MHRKTGKQVNKIEDIPGSATVEMNFTRTSSNPEVENFQISDSYIPITPLKPILPKSTPISTQRQENWYSEEGFLFSNGFAHGTQDYRIPACCETANSVDITNGFHNWEEALAGRSHDSGGDHIFRDFSADPNTFQNGSFGNLIALANAAATRETQNAAPQGDVNAETGSFFPVFKTHFDSNRFEASSATSSPAKQDFPYESNLWSNGNWAPDMPLFANSIPPHPTYDLNSPPDALMDAFLGQNIPTQFAPITPDLSKSKNGMQNLSADERRNQTRQEGNEIATTRLEVEELHNKDQQKVPKGLSSTVESTQLQENHNSDKGGNAEIDLNKTPHQKTKRKKHRPKVVTEDKPKRTPKAVTPKAEGTTENLTGKRKYVRKNELNETPHTPTAEVASQDTSPRNASLTEKPCKRALIFDLEGEVRKESNVDSESQAQNFSTRVESKSKVQLGQGIEVVIEKTELGIAYDLTCSVNKVLEDYISMPERQPINPNTPNKTDSLQRDMMAHVQNDHARGKCQIVFSDETHDKQKSNMNVSMRTETQSTRLNSMIEEKQERGLKRGNLHMNGEAGPNCKHVVGGHYNSLHEYLAMFSANSLNSNGIAGMHFPTIYKKKRSEKVHSSTTSSSVCVVNSSENHAKNAIQYSNISAAPHTTEYTSIRTASYLDSLGKQSFECGPAVDQKGRMKKKRSKGPTRVRDLASLMGIVACGRFPTFPAGRAPICDDMQKYGISNPPKSIEALVAETRATMTTKKRTKRISFTTSTNTGAIQKRPSTIEEIIGLLESLDINSHRNQVRKQDKRALVPFNFRFEERNALVLYQREGTVAPFEGSFDPIRKRRPRPKVDLDEETNRVWKLLLENINSEGIDGTDEDKAKWWEEERRVFQGRADSFIARMHLVQGDRRFSPWKGSVLDSVVGVFLTQNVSDHLSSSAFMSLAARFPLNSNGDCRPCSEGTNILDKKPEVCILDTEDIVEWHSEKWDRSTIHMNSIKLHDKQNIAGTEVVNSDESLGRSSSCEKSTDQMKCKSFGIFGKGLEIDDSSITQREAFQLKEVMESLTGEREMDDVLSSQFSVSTSKDSVDSSVAQTSGSMEPCLQENLETVPGTRSKPDNFLLPSFVELLQMAESSHGVHDKKTANVSSFKENGFTNMEATECDAQRERLDMSNNRQASLRPINPSRNYNLQMNPNARATRVESWEILGAERPFFSNFKRHEENCMSEQSGVTAESVSQVTVQKNETSSSLEVPKYPSESNHVCSSPQVDVNNTIPSQNMLSGHPKDNIQSERESTNMINIKKKTEHKEVESSLNERGYFPDKAINGRISDSSKLRGRIGKQKQSSENWDSLRLQAQAEGKRRARTANTMDSLDWEAVRCADVNEIADTIKERGMNNLLAERIKDFLNRLVREHGNTELEWLRDVPPDKAKEYLLSIRGLGLKSVECVRLLTLHHLAFPVDTNVGRIAVRLGWVPLQPLPESLQLHLLELYPVLESIQRYLWPRLCKLDQRTLYELHYQMITFGKVFCTKNKPNCNACPMRGECRHFASAFASARLALPGPEERSIVSAMENKSTYQNPVGVIKHLQLPQPQSNHQLQTQYQLNCLPIVEVPATPEPIVEVPATPELEQPPQIPERDIEDAFGEDPEEIPTIKLNIEEFAQNLQNYMHQNMELQESDVSKALVALTSEAASIPTPKLKNVSRLRTEHHVYELPDSHPLLEGLDRREPDDPCSYLLAIWTPGETASSITPPEGKCSSQEFGQLCDEMTCFSCNSIREATSQTVRGTLLIPCRTAMRGSFPLNGTYFQVNEVFADHASSMNPIDVPRAWIWNLPRRTVYFGTSIPSIFKGLTTESIQFCFWRGFVCVRGFDQKTRSPRPLMARLHFPASKLARTKGKPTDQQE